VRWASGKKGNSELMLKIDMHVHTWYSDSTASVDEVLEAARFKGLDGVAITDHNTVVGALEAERKRGDLIVIPGEEVSTLHGEIIALGVRSVIPKGLPVTEAIRRVHSQGGFVVVPHPTVPFIGTFGEKIIRRLPVDGIEVFSAITPFPGYHFKKNLRLARSLGLPMLAGSDSHFPETVGDAYTIVYSEGPSVEEILDAVRRGRTKVGCRPSSWTFKVRMLRGFFASLPWALLKRRPVPL